MITIMFEPFMGMAKAYAYQDVGSLQNPKPVITKIYHTKVSGHHIFAGSLSVILAPMKMKGIEPHVVIRLCVCQICLASLEFSM